MDRMRDQDARNNQHRGPRPPDHVIRGDAAVASIKVFKPAWGTDHSWVYVVCVGLERMNQKMVRAPLPEVRKIVREAKDWIDEHVRTHGAVASSRFFFHWED